ncbi:MAG: hypothetical protein KKF46_04850 [Nanoarchaeota archaeon]|nr:hypothetical protein [Nanoarchaeota archaeon]MBU1321661.1 hypothetical protein [Nanoarchaeota archaeon]MBU1596881.1 hypothetical protein [Nanoarchaeota archaeon]MBU2442330.1 hypothetical protein [Nanoarchaeota archaeon]
MKNKNIIFAVFLLIVLVVFLFSVCSCTRKAGEPAYEINISEEGQGVVITLDNTNESGVVIVLDKNITSVPVVLSDEAEEKEEPTETEVSEQSAEQTMPEEQSETATEPKRQSEVEFYFLLKGRSYFQHILKENQIKIYIVSGRQIQIQPIIITQNNVKFRINDFTTKTLAEGESDSTQEFEIFVKDIYYRP